MATTAQHRRALELHRRKVEAARDAYRATIEARNEAVRAAKADGMPAREAYTRAGVTQSTFSRQQQDP